MPRKSSLQKRIDAVSERNRTRGIYGNEVKRRLLRERATELILRGTIKTSGAFGEHTIELLDGGDEERYWIRVDGEIRRPRTARGVKNIIARWIIREAQR